MDVCGVQPAGTVNKEGWKMTVWPAQRYRPSYRLVIEHMIHFQITISGMHVLWPWANEEPLAFCAS
jgi:hypothetical protein